MVGVPINTAVSQLIGVNIMCCDIIHIVWLYAVQGCRLPGNWERLVLRVASPESSCHHADYRWKSSTWWSQFNLQWYLCPKFQRKILWLWDWFGFSRTISLPLVGSAMAISRLFVSMLHFHYLRWENLSFRNELYIIEMEMELRYALPSALCGSFSDLCCLTM